MGIETGFIELDEKLRGIKKGEVICIASRPAMGKTTFALNLVRNLTIQQISTAIFSLDSSKSMIIDKIKNIEFSVFSTFIQTSINLLLFENHIYIYDNILNIKDIEQTARKLKLKENIDLIVIDYLQLIKSDTTIEDTIKRLKALAKELNVPVLILSQLSRELESREDNKPNLTDFKKSSAIVGYADTIMFVYRDNYYNKDNDEPYNIEIIVAKNKRGNIGTVNLIDVNTSYCE